MEIEKFKELLNEKVKKIDIKLSETQLNQFFSYMNILIEWNKVMNLTGIVEPEQIIIKHFIDSLEILKYVEEKNSIIDVGTGAGFPGIPIKIALPQTKVVLLDSLNKRINFLNEVIKKLNLKDIETIHGRAEDFGNNDRYREKFDIAVARAVAPLNVLVEYLMPFVKVNGKCLCMKSQGAEEEIKKSKRAINLLGGYLIKTEDFMIPDTDIVRRIVTINKKESTNKIYPRKAGIPVKNPL